MKTLYVDNTLYSGHCTGTAQGGSNDPPGITLAASCPEADGAYVDWGLRIISGTGAGQSMRIVAYSSATKVAEVEYAWATVPDATSVYEITFGCDTNMGLYRVLGAGGPLRSVERAMVMVTPGDTVHVKAGRAHTLGDGTGAIATIHIAGLVVLPIRVIGYKDQPGDAAGRWGDPLYQAVLDAGGVLTNVVNVDAALSGDLHLGYEFANMRFVNAMGAGVVTGSGRSGTAFYNCVSTGNGGRGFDLGNQARLMGCEAWGNGGTGIAAGTGSHVDCGRAYGNGDHQISLSGQVNFTVVYGIPNGKRGISMTGGAATADAVRNCVIDGLLAGGSSTGIHFGGRVSSLVNTIVYRCGLGISQGSANQISFSTNNLYFGNTTNRQGWPADLWGEVTADPKFTDVDARDYRLRADSPGVGAGWPASLDMGAFQRQAVVCGSPMNVGMADMILIQQGEKAAVRREHFVQMVDSADRVTPKTGLSPTVQIIKAGGSSYGEIAGTCEEVGSGTYRIELALADVDTAGAAMLKVAADGAVTQHVPMQVVRFIDEIHLAKAALVNARSHTIDTGVDEIKDDDGATVLRTLTPSESNGVVAVTPT